MTDQTIVVFGHKIPDTDAIASALVMADWLNQQGLNATAYRLGEPNLETQFLLDFAKTVAPKLLTPEDLTKLYNPVLALTDHNESQQSIENLKDFTIGYVIDHHKLGDLTTFEPAYIRIEPLGSACTILYKMYQEYGLTPTPTLATLMAGAMISDTLNLTSPTTTDSDRKFLPKVLNLANIQDGNAFANQLFMAKSNISYLSDEQLVTADYKQFNFTDTAGKVAKWGIAVIETVNPSQAFGRVNGIQTASQTVRQRDGLDYFLVLIVDIVTQRAWAVASVDEQNQMIIKAFKAELQESLLDLGNLVSRKKQFVPTLEKFYGK